MEDPGTTLKKKLGRPRKSAAEKKTENLQRVAAKKTALAVQQETDLLLLRLTKEENPFQHNLMKRKETWLAVARGRSDLF